MQRCVAGAYKQEKVPTVQHALQPYFPCCDGGNERAVLHTTDWHYNIYLKLLECIAASFVVDGCIWRHVANLEALVDSGAACVDVYFIESTQDRIGVLCVMYMFFR